MFNLSNKFFGPVPRLECGRFTRLEGGQDITGNAGAISKGTHLKSRVTFVGNGQKLINCIALKRRLKNEGLG